MKKWADAMCMSVEAVTERHSHRWYTGLHGSIGLLDPAEPFLRKAGLAAQHADSLRLGSSCTGKRLSRTSCRRRPCHDLQAPRAETVSHALPQPLLCHDLCCRGQGQHQGDRLRLACIGCKQGGLLQRRLAGPGLERCRGCWQLPCHPGAGMQALPQRLVGSLAAGQQTPSRAVGQGCGPARAYSSREAISG